MMHRPFALLAALSFALVVPVTLARAQGSQSSAGYPDEFVRYSDDQLDNLVGPVALYPDALLAQLLIAATFPDQVQYAANYVRRNGTDGIDDQPWDVSVKALAHYPSALNMMSDRGSDWTTTLGRAYAIQSSDVMAAVQRMRSAADGQGNLRSTNQQTITRDDGNYVIAPTQTRVIYVPVYDAYEVYTRPIFGPGFSTPFWSFGVGFPIGGWLSYDLNWRTRTVFYHGWESAYYGHGGGWRYRSRPFIHVTNIYVNPRYRTVNVNRDVIRRRIEYRNVDRYVGYHRDVRFGRSGIGYRDPRTPSREDSREDRNRQDTWRAPQGSDRRVADRTGTRDVQRASDHKTFRTGSRIDDGRIIGNDRSVSGNDTRIRGRGSIGSESRTNDRRSIGNESRSYDRGTIGNESRNYDRGSIGNESRNYDRGSIGRENRLVPEQPQYAPPRGDASYDRGQSDRQRGGGFDRQPRGEPRQVERAPQQRNDAPMINPRRREAPQQDRGTGGGQGGGQRGGGRQARERPMM